MVRRVGPGQSCQERFPGRGVGLTAVPPCVCGHTPRTSVTLCVLHTPWTSQSHSGHILHSMYNSYSVCIFHPMPTSHICVFYIEDVSSTLCILLTPCPSHTHYTSHSMCIPRKHVYLTHCAHQPYRTLLCPTGLYSRPGTTIP